MSYPARAEGLGKYDKIISNCFIHAKTEKKNFNVWVCLMVYQPSWVIQCQRRPCRRTVLLYGHLQPITKTIEIRQTGNAGNCWRSRDELINDVLQWTPSHGHAQAGQLTRTYIQQLCAYTGYSPGILPGATNDREGCRERLRDIRADSITWWWWWWWLVLFDR